MSDNSPNDETQFYSDLLRAFFDSTNDAIFVLCDEMKFIICNKMTQQWLGIPEDKLTEHNKRIPITELLGHQDAVDLFKSSFEHALNNEHVVFETQICPLNGEDRWIELSMKRVDIENGDMIITVARDITERIIAKAEKDRLQRELSQSQKMDALGQLTGGIAHDFNNILGIISGYTELAINKHQIQNTSIPIKYLENIQQSSNRAKKLIAQLMVFSRIENTESEPLQLAPLIEEDIKMLRATMPSSIEFNLSYEDNVPDVVMEPVNLQQLLINLCINAKDAMNEMGTISISLRLNQKVFDECSSCHKHIHGDWVELTITDTGSGISQDTIKRIFDPFFTTKSVGKGTGMGLAMVGSIVESFGGHIIVRTAAGVGTSIHLLFPPAIDHTSKNSQDDKVPIPDVTSGEGKSILIVDDEPGLASLMSEMLQTHGYKCTFQTSSSDALTLFRSSPDSFDLVISDQTMPGLTGSEMITKIREIRPQQAIILTTGYSETMNKETAREQGIDFMQKPVDTNKLLNLMHKIFKS